jgi:hypothetical protein
MFSTRYVFFLPRDGKLCYAENPDWLGIVVMDSARRLFSASAEPCRPVGVAENGAQAIEETESSTKSQASRNDGGEARGAIRDSLGRFAIIGNGGANRSSEFRVTAPNAEPRRSPSRLKMAPQAIEKAESAAENGVVRDDESGASKFRLSPPGAAQKARADTQLASIRLHRRRPTAIFAR